MAGARIEPKRRLKVQPKSVPTPEQLVTAVAHPVRRRILRTLHDAGEARSSAELSLALDLILSNVSYHVRALTDGHALALTDSRPVRGSVESFYASTVEDDHWLRLVLDATRRQDGDA
jgi:DNA-binding transcriptional ArsR family regulator